MKSSAAILILSIFCSCANEWPVPGKYKKALNCYAGAYTGIDTLINIHGFYTQGPSRISESPSNFMFFNDGIFVGQIEVQGQSVADYITAKAKAGKSFDFRAFYHGTFKISGNIIKVQYLNDGGGNAWGGNEIWYKILDKNTIVDFYSKYLVISSGDKKKQGYGPVSYSDRIPSSFVYLDSIPRSSTWLKSKKWFYCNP